MTVTYTSQVADCKGFGCFWKLLFRWRGSIYKLVYTDLLAYSSLYFLLSGIYRFGLSPDGKRLFEKISIYTEFFTELIPISFVLGFYVSIVVQRWWAQFELLPWPDSLSLYISTSIPGNDNRGRMMRRTIVRYANLSFTLTLIMISPAIKKRFPTLDHLIEAGLLTSNEKKIFEDLLAKTTHPMYWMPLVWAGTVVARARKEGRIRDDFAVKTIIDEINRLRGLCGSLLSYDWISIPLVYTQVVTLAVYTFFLATLMGRQFLDPAMKYEKNSMDLIFPVFTYLQFFFYMGWLKVAESLVNPFGEDDDDFEINWLIDRNVQISYLIVDEMHNEHPELIQDIYWDEIFPTELPYTIAAQEFRTEPPQGSTANLDIPAEEQEILPVVEEETLDDEFDPPPANRSFPNFNTNMKRIGSNLSAMFHYPSIPKSSVLPFTYRSSSSVRKPSYRRNLPRNGSKSSGATLSPTFLHNRESNSHRMSDLSFTGSDHESSKDSINTDFSQFSKPIKIRRRGTLIEDVGIQFNIKKKDKYLEANDRLSPDFDTLDVTPERGEKLSSSLDTPNEFERKRFLLKHQRGISVDESIARERLDPERRVSFDAKDLPGSAPSKFPEFIKLMPPKSSSESLKDPKLQPTTDGSNIHVRSSSMSKPITSNEQHHPKITLSRKPILRSFSSNTFDSGNTEGPSKTALSPKKYMPLTHTFATIPRPSTPSTPKETEAPMSTAVEPLLSGNASNWNEPPEHKENTVTEPEKNHEEAHNESNTSIWL